MQGEGGSAVGLILFGIIYLGIIVAMIAGLWKVFVKAGKPGWAVLVPIYNIIVLLEIAGRPIWWIVLFVIPVANLVAAVLISIDIARGFGKDTGYGIGLLLLPFVFYPLLGFGDAQYQRSPQALPA
ncbi:MAG: signal peptidase I [Deltaproteobacteria bacterium]|nr:MAG: signal peptidase I [Deltaproteobacteria bacterium]